MSELTLADEIADLLDFLSEDPPCECGCHAYVGEEVPAAVALIRFKGGIGWRFTNKDDRYVCDKCLKIAQAKFGDELEVFPLRKPEA